MARIHRTDIYDYDTIPTVDDYVIGTDDGDSLRTKNYRIGDIVSLAPGGGGSTTFIALTDTPSSFASQTGLVPMVNVGETALEFIEVVTLDTVQTITGNKFFDTTLPVPFGQGVTIGDGAVSDVIGNRLTFTNITNPGAYQSASLPSISFSGNNMIVNRAGGDTEDTNYTLNSDNLTSAQTLTIQDASGTIAYLSDTITQVNNGASPSITTVFNDLYNTVPATVVLSEFVIGDVVIVNGTISCQKNATTATNAYTAIFEIPVTQAVGKFSPITVWATNFSLEPSAVLEGNVDVDDKITLTLRIISAAGAGTGSADIFFSGIYVKA